MHNHFHRDDSNAVYTNVDNDTSVEVTIDKPLCLSVYSNSHVLHYDVDEDENDANDNIIDVNNSFTDSLQSKLISQSNTSTSPSSSSSKNEHWFSLPLPSPTLQTINTLSSSSAAAAAVASKRPKLITTLSSLLPHFAVINVKQFVSLYILSSLPLVLLVGLFSSIGFGIDFIRVINNANFSVRMMSLVLSLIIVLTMVIFDSNKWSQTSHIKLRSSLRFITITMLSGALVLSTNAVPCAPICSFILLTPLYLLSVHKHVYSSSLFALCGNRQVKVAEFMRMLSGPLFLFCITVVVVWIIWIFGSTNSSSSGGELSTETEKRDISNTWSVNLRNVYAVDVCAPDFEEYPKCEEYYTQTSNEWRINHPKKCYKVYDGCLTSFFVWAAPLLGGAYYYFLCHLIGFICCDADVDDDDDVDRDGSKVDDHERTTCIKDDSEITTPAPSPPHSATNAISSNTFIKAPSNLILLLLFLTWLIASLTTPTAPVTNTFITLLITTAISSGLMYINMHTKEYTHANIITPLLAEFHKRFGDDGVDWAAAGGMLFGLHFCAVYSFIIWGRSVVRMSGLNWMIRPATVIAIDSTHINASSPTCDRFKNRSWNYPSLLNKSILLGLILLTLRIFVQKVVYIFLSYLTINVTQMPLINVTLVMLVVGLLLFIFPPIPGVPIYFTCGIILVSAGRATFGLIGAVAFTQVFCIALKLLACTIQMQLIGVPLKGSVRIRQVILINSKLIRTIRIILSTPGYTRVKVAVLVAGPDWPTSVLCGVMGLPLSPMLIGTLPVVVVLVPTVMSGVFIYMSSSSTDDDDEGDNMEWTTTASAICLSLTGIIIFALPVYMVKLVNTAMAEYEDELVAMPLDNEVQEADDRDAHWNYTYSEVTKWNNLPFLTKLLHVTGFVTIYIATTLTMYTPNLTFKSFEITDNINEALDGDIWSVIEPLGWVVIVLFCTSGVCIVGVMVFGRVATNHTVKNGNDESIVERGVNVDLDEGEEDNEGEEKGEGLIGVK